MTHKHLLSCECGEVKGSITLPKELSEYSPRECDCDFCTSRGIAYLSDPGGVISIKSERELPKIQQGSNQADFLICVNCKQVIVASFEKSSRLIGALNVQLLDLKDEMRGELGESIVVSPKKLSVQEKIDRWAGVWCILEIQISA